MSDSLRERPRNRVAKKTNKTEKKIAINESLDVNNIAQIIKEFMKRSDVIDEIYGKSISEDRFITASAITNLISIT
jgi:hypothetical protein